MVSHHFIPVAIETDRVFGPEFEATTFFTHVPGPTSKTRSVIWCEEQVWPQGIGTEMSLYQYVRKK